MTIENQEGWGDMMEEVEGDFGKYSFIVLYLYIYLLICIIYDYVSYKFIVKIL